MTRDNPTLEEQQEFLRLCKDENILQKSLDDNLTDKQIECELLLDDLGSYQAKLKMLQQDTNTPENDKISVIQEIASQLKQIIQRLEELGYLKEGEEEEQPEEEEYPKPSEYPYPSEKAIPISKISKGRFTQDPDY